MHYYLLEKIASNSVLFVAEGSSVLRLAPLKKQINIEISKKWITQKCVKIRK